MAARQDQSGLGGLMPSAMTDLGFGMGDSLKAQQQQETEEERKRRRLGLSPMQSPAAQQLLGLGGMGGYGRY